MPSVLASVKNLVDGAGGVSSVADALAHDVIGLYFSAHWCPPCRGFTPKLVSVVSAHSQPRGGRARD